MSTYAQMQQTAAEYRVADRSALRCWAGVNCCVAVFYLVACLFMIFYVQWKLDFVFPPGSGLQMADVNYYNCNATLEASTAADYMSGASWALYGEDVLRLLVVFAVLGYAWLAPLCGWYTSAPLIFLLILFGLYDLGKGIYVTLIYTNSISPACQEYPFCTSHDFCTPGTQMAPGTPDVTFEAEMYAAYAFGVVELIWACLVYRVIPKKRHNLAMATAAFEPVEARQPSATTSATAAHDSGDDELDRVDAQLADGVVEHTNEMRKARKRALKPVEHRIPRVAVVATTALQK